MVPFHFCIANKHTKGDFMAQMHHDQTCTHTRIECPGLNANFSPINHVFTKCVRDLWINRFHCNVPPNVGDGSPSTFWDNVFWQQYVPSSCKEGPTYVIADVIHSVLPEAKILAIFRNPTDRWVLNSVWLPKWHEYWIELDIVENGYVIAVPVVSKSSYVQ